MTVKEYLELLHEIQINHNNHMKKNSDRKIKYVTSRYDTRDGQVYSITFKEWFTSQEKTFTEATVKDILKWLKGGS